MVIDLNSLTQEEPMTPTQENLHKFAEEILQDKSERCFRVKAHGAFRKYDLPFSLWEDAFKGICDILRISAEQANSRGRFKPKKNKVAPTSVQQSRRVGIENSVPIGDRD